jgi:hypothetical protein
LRISPFILGEFGNLEIVLDVPVRKVKTEEEEERRWNEKPPR